MNCTPELFRGPKLELSKMHWWEQVIVFSAEYESDAKNTVS